MFQPPPEDHNDKISEQPMPPLPALGDAPAEETHLAANAPQGDELFYYVLGCLDKGSSKAEVRKQLIAFGYTAGEAEETVETVADWRRKNPDHRASRTPPARPAAAIPICGSAASSA
jgi:hypothetical protein